MRLCVKNIKVMKRFVHCADELEAVKKISQAEGAKLDKLLSEYVQFYT